MRGLVIRFACAVVCMALFVAGLVFARTQHVEHVRARAELAQVRQERAALRQAAEISRQAWQLLDQAGAELAALEPVPINWTSYPLAISTTLDPTQTRHALGLLSRVDDWSFARTHKLTLRSECGTDPCATFHLDLEATIYAPTNPGEVR
jgi:hypothetical protein